MAKIAVCDDNPSDLARMQSLLRETGVAADAELYSSGEALIDAVRRGAGYDVYFVDVVMGGLSGIETARQLNQLSPRSFDLVFTTNSVDFALDAFGVSAIDYLLKPIDPEKLQRAVARCRNLAVLPECITLSKNKKDYRIVKSEIVYIESYAHVCVFHTNDSEFSANIAISAVLPQLNDAAFARCHKSYIVNLAYVQKINGDYLLLRNGSVIPTGRSMRKQLHALYDEDLIRRVWEKRRSD